MNTPSPEEERIEEIAADWLAQREESFSTVQTRKFERWCKLDPRHAAAVARLEETCALLETMPLVRAELQPVVPFPSEGIHVVSFEKPPRRFPLLRIVAGLAAAMVLTAVVWRQAAPASPTALHYTTSSGGYERVVLNDGSVMELNANTEVRVEFAPSTRRVALLSGEAHFTVAHDTTRPFIVAAKHLSVRAVGTAFNVRFASTAVEVLVTEGKVQLRTAALDTGAGADPAAPAPVALLSANERLLVPANDGSRPLPGTTLSVIEKVSPELVHAALAWQERKLVFADTPLREVVAQFNRRNRMQLIIADASLGERPVGGTFAADNVEGFIRLFEGGNAFKIERRGEFEIVLRAAH